MKDGSKCEALFVSTKSIYAATPSLGFCFLGLLLNSGEEGESVWLTAKCKVWGTGRFKRY